MQQLPESAAQASFQPPPFVGRPSQLRTNLYISSLPKHATKEELTQLFQPFGQIETSTVARDSSTGFCKGYGFVKFVSDASASHALSVLNGVTFLGRTIQVKLADAKANPPPSSGGHSTLSDSVSQHQLQQAQIPDQGYRYQPLPLYQQVPSAVPQYAPLVQPQVTHHFGHSAPPQAIYSPPRTAPVPEPPQLPAAHNSQRPGERGSISSLDQSVSSVPTNSFTMYPNFRRISETSPTGTPQNMYDPSSQSWNGQAERIPQGGQQPPPHFSAPQQQSQPTYHVMSTAQWSQMQSQMIPAQGSPPHNAPVFGSNQPQVYSQPEPNNKPHQFQSYQHQVYFTSVGQPVSGFVDSSAPTGSEVRYVKVRVRHSPAAFSETAGTL